MSFQPLIDLRSDTVTRPTAAMRQAIANADVNDDVIDVNPTCRRLEDLTAEILGKEAALFMPSGTMTNQVGVRIHCKPGDEFLCEAGCHIYNYEQGAFAQLSGVVARTIEGEQSVLALRQLQGLIRPENDHLVRTRLVCLENTHNRGGGKIQPYAQVAEICEWARGAGLRTHLDGARLWNAAVATRIPESTWAQHFDTVSVCFSKGLGAPIGSALAGSKEAIAEARRHRKLFGGAMRQSGVIAAAALYALQHHRERLADDHANAQILVEALSQAEGLSLCAAGADTNIVIFNVSPRLGSAAELAAALKARGVWGLAVSAAQIRLVTHLDVSDADCRRAARILIETADQLLKGDRTAAAALEPAY